MTAMIIHMLMCKYSQDFLSLQLLEKIFFYFVLNLETSFKVILWMEALIHHIQSFLHFHIALCFPVV